MAEQAAGAVASAVVNGITDRALTTVMRKLRPGSRPAAAHEKLQRLETLVLKLRCAVEVSEKHAIESESLLRWRDKLREAAAEGGAVVLDFQRRAREAAAAETSANASAAGQQQPAAGTTAGALYFTRSALSGMAQRVRDATRRLFSTDEDTQKLDSALEKMEELSPGVTLFATLLQLEVASPKPSSSKRRAPGESPSVRKRLFHCKLAVRSVGVWVEDCELEVFPLQKVRVRRLGRETEELPSPNPSPSRRWVVESGQKVSTPWDSSEQARAALEATRLASAEAAEDLENEARTLGTVLEQTSRRIDSCIDAADGKDMEGLGWLAEWAAVVREAAEPEAGRGGMVGTGDDALDADGDLYGFVRAVGLLARDQACFAILVSLCPRKQ